MTAVFLIDDDVAVLSAVSLLLRRADFEVHPFSNALDYLKVAPSLPMGVLVTDVRMPELDGLELLRRRQDARMQKGPVVVMTGHADVPMAVEAMRLGAFDIIEKPFDPALMVSIVKAAALSFTPAPETLGLTLRERQIANAVCQGQTSKQIALDLGLSHRTVEVFRARILKKTGAANAAALAALLKLKG